VYGFPFRFYVVSVLFYFLLQFITGGWIHWALIRYSDTMLQFVFRVWAICWMCVNWAQKAGRLYNGIRGKIRQRFAYALLCVSDGYTARTLTLSRTARVYF